MSSSVRAAKRLGPAKLSIIGFAVVALLTAILMMTVGQGFAMPANPQDETKVPHYFGPYPNWANSPLTLPDVVVTVDPPGNGTTATATATVGANGSVTGITITDPGSGYTAAPNVTINNAGGTNPSAMATATFTATGSVTAITVDTPGARYTTPQVNITGDGAGAKATAFGGVDSLTLNPVGTGYHMPTVSFDLPDDPNGTRPTAHVVCAEANCSNPNPDGTPGVVHITDVVLDTPGSGYSAAPGVAILDGTQFDPIKPSGTGAKVTATISVDSVTMDAIGSGYTTAVVDIADTGGTPTTKAAATAVIETGAITAIDVTNPGSGYVTTGGIKKFVDGLPLLGEAGANNLGQYLPVAVPDTTTFTTANGFDQDADYYVIALVQHREQMSSSLPAQGTLLREYVQLETGVVTGKGVALANDMLDGSSVPALMPDGTQAVGVDNPHFLGPVIAAQRDKPVRIVFYNLLPTGSGGDLFLPTDSTIMGSGPTPGAPNSYRDPQDLGTVMDGVRNPACTENTKGTDTNCFKDNRATLHLHGGVTPWISDGTPHQWITPAKESTSYPEGVSVKAVPDMSNVPGVPDCSAKDDGCMTFYYTNQQSARFMFYHDHAWGITRLNVYAGEAAGYLISDPTEQKLVADGTIPTDQIPLVIQDRTFVPSDAQLYGANGVYGQDPTWDQTRWGGEGNLWYHHVYMPAQNPGDPSGMSAYGRWMYGPWFWPPATPPHGPIDNPYYDPNCNLDDPATWQYQTDPFCEPAQIPGTPNISAGMEQFNDTPIVNGTAYPTTTVEPKAYRFRILNAANDRFFNLQLYVADPNQLADPTDPTSGTEVAFKAAELAAAQTDPNVFPTPDTAVSLPGPDWIQIGTEGGFLPAPAVVHPQATTWITDPTRFDFGNVDKHSLLLAPAERADVIVDFSKFAGKTLILYNDAPAAFPARVASYDYYTGAPDLSPVGAPGVLPGYGPNTRTVMQIKVAGTQQPTFNLTKLQNAFKHNANGTGVFESGQHPIIVGQAAYNSAYGTSFAASGNCTDPNGTNKCDGYARINQQGGDLFRFDTLLGPQQKIKLQPKAIHDEMNAVAFDEFGRMTANLGVEAVPATPAGQNITLYPYVNPQTEIIDASGLPVGDINVTPISTSDDGTQIWKITHNGVDTHPIHWHLYDVQVLNRVTWDNIIIPPDATELGWKDTLRISPLEDTIVALRPIIPTLPFDLPNSTRPLNPWTPVGSPMGFNNVDPQGNPTAAITNQWVNFGWEYVFHCHILSHEEMDMMRPVSVALPPRAPDGLAVDSIVGNGNRRTLTLSWNDNSLNETSFVVQRTTDGTIWTDVATSVSPLDQTNTEGVRRTAQDANYNPTTAYLYRVVALNEVGYGVIDAAYPSLSLKSVSSGLGVYPPAAPTNLVAAYQFTATQAGPRVNLTWTDNATNESGFVITKTDNGGAPVQTQVSARNGTGSVTYVDTNVLLGHTYTYQVASVNVAGQSAPAPSAPLSLAITTVSDPTNLAGTAARQGGNERVTLTWTDNATNESGYVVQRSTDVTFNTGVTAVTLAANTQTYTTGNITRTTWYFRIRAFNATGSSNWVSVTVAPAP
jgi:FtsP/CotA-like multicopper oxidase with cupredoxin domain